MICCRPPFQAGSSTEIYQKAKAVDYQWPTSETIHNHVPEEAKDLVAALLRPNPADRLGLDEVVSHPFFRMHGADCIPAVLDSSCKIKKPNWLSSAEPRGDVMKADAPRLKLRELAESCGVGYFSVEQGSFNVVGGDVDISLYRACLAEEVADTCPRVPLPADVVYIGKTSVEARSLIQDSIVPAVPPIPRTTLCGKSRRVLEILEEDGAVDLGQRPASQRIVSHYHAGNPSNPQAKKPQGHAPSRAVPDTAACEQAVETRERPAVESASVRVPSGLVNGRPVRMAKTLPRNTSRVTRSQKAGSTKETAIPIYDEEKKSSPRLTKDQIIDQLSPNPDEKRREMALRGKARIAANLQNELNALNNEDRKHSNDAFLVRARTPPKPVGWLVSPKEKVESLPGTTANDVLAGLKLLRNELDQAFQIAAADPHAPGLHASGSEGKPGESPPFLTKWVDYTNKLGVGYSLANGSMGCLIKANEGYDNPQCGVLVANIRRHYLNRNNPSYSEALTSSLQRALRLNLVKYLNETE